MALLLPLRVHKNKFGKPNTAVYIDSWASRSLSVLEGSVSKIRLGIRKIRKFYNLRLDKTSGRQPN